MATHKSAIETLGNGNPQITGTVRLFQIITNTVIVALLSLFGWLGATIADDVAALRVTVASEQQRQTDQAQHLTSIDLSLTQIQASMYDMRDRLARVEAYETDMQDKTFKGPR